jgi:hypothetical protein
MVYTIKLKQTDCPGNILFIQYKKMILFTESDRVTFFSAKRIYVERAMAHGVTYIQQVLSRTVGKCHPGCIPKYSSLPARSFYFRSNSDQSVQTFKNNLLVFVKLLFPIINSLGEKFSSSI